MSSDPRWPADAGPLLENLIERLGAARNPGAAREMDIKGVLVVQRPSGRRQFVVFHTLDFEPLADLAADARQQGIVGRGLFPAFIAGPH